MTKFCGGVILKNNWILSAARCFEGPQRDAYINAGVTNANDYNPPSQHIKFEKFILHDKWNPITGKGDIALLKLETPLNFSQVIQAIQLPPKGYTATGVGNIIGWSVRNNDGTAQTMELLSTNVSVLSSSGI